MNWSIQNPIHVGGLTFGAIIETEVSVRSSGSHLAASAEKRPLLILLMKAGSICGIDINGHTYEAQEIETLYPGAISNLDKSAGT